MPVPAIPPRCWSPPVSTTCWAGRRRRSPSSWAPVARTSRACSPRRRNRASSRSGSTTRRAASTRARGRPARHVRPPGRAGGPRGTGPRPAGRGPGRHPGSAPAARQHQGLDDGGAVVGPRPAVDGVRHDLRPGVPRAQPRAAGGGVSSISNEISGQELVREARRTPQGAVPLPARTGDVRVRPVARRAAGGAVHRRRSPRRARRPGLRGDRHPSRGSSAAILASMNLSPADRARSGPPSRSATSPRATTTPRASRSTGRSRPDPRGQPRRAAPHPQRRRGRPGPGEDARRPGALRGHIIDSLVCDDTLARSLLSEARTSPNDTGGI